MDADGDDARLRELTVEKRGEHFLAVRFSAMAGPCEVLLPHMNAGRALGIAAVAAREAWRVERKFSRYRTDSVVAAIHSNRGKRMSLDEETAGLVDFAAQCYALSDGLFDITSGIFRQAWKFDGSDRVPDRDAVAALSAHVGFNKLDWHRPDLTLPEKMELDFGGIGKEYAVDRAFDLLAQRRADPFLINFGGDIRANRAPLETGWQVGIEQPDAPGDAFTRLDLKRGALATSGDSHRFLLKDGVRYGHILNPRTGWPVPKAPRSITVAASSCTEAGFLSTWAMLHGNSAGEFLREMSAIHWIEW